MGGKMVNGKIVCLGGGIGTVNLIRGLKSYTKNITVIVSMADDGGSSGRLRRLYNIFPPGDIVSCMTALSSDQNAVMARLLSYRFPGNRYAKDDSLSGQRMGGLIMVALRDITGDFLSAIEMFQKLFHIKGTFLPATAEEVSISVRTKEGKQVDREEKIDLGKYRGQKSIDHVFLNPPDVPACPQAVEEIKQADVIIAGPGDLYSTILPTLIVPEIKETLLQSRAKKIFVVNVANKPSETKGYTLSDYVQAIEKHVGEFPFNTVIANNNFTHEIPKQYRYSYVALPDYLPELYQLVQADLIDDEFPLYHSSTKLAKLLSNSL